MKSLSFFDRLRVWAAITGLLVATCYFTALYLGMAVSPMLPLLIAGIGGFEIFHWAQDIAIERKRRGEA